MGKYIGIQPFNPWLRRACVYVDNTHILVPDSKNESPFSDGTKNYLVESILWTKTLKQFICHRILAIGVFHCTRPGSGQRCITIITLTCLADIVFWQRSGKIQSFEILQIPEACIYNMNVGHISLLFFVFTCNFQRQIEPGIECLKDPSPPHPTAKITRWFLELRPFPNNSEFNLIIWYRHDLAICNMHCRFEKCTLISWVLCWPLSWI